VTSLSELFNDTAPFILAPRLIISIWDTHAHDDCVYVNPAFADCACLTLPPARTFDPEEPGGDSQSEWICMTRGTAYSGFDS
jgi:hypothetical protein